MSHDPLRPTQPHPGRRRTDDASELERLKREIALRDDVLSLAAHELRNPLHALALHLALARSTAQAGNAAEAAERIRRAELTLRRYSERVTVLMELLASPGATYPLARQRIDVPALVASLVDSLEQEGRSRGIAVRVVFDEATFGPMRAVDPVAFEQVVDNLLLNAFKHSSASDVTIRLSSGGHAWSVQVEDNGRGIALADQKTVFEKFAVAAHSSRGAGTGLGLWIVTRLVQAMDGEVTLQSAPGTGCVFTVRIPEADDMSTHR
ncbi:sensor histidine kinase [Scleromatobacter humisilvae]|uniref:histidine kinase n=1 Tax=Scleromatobacter humisilvae TaxID=2897159 RepID=A0A9X2BZD5_9BURK|nr:HAMP domain-containing sensor histidine kinase [Scleromatobacter humisilvae]MCK9686207.1 HAMP domain-containing histidine kinase [Scleromatobacter humisilvae]